MKARRRSSLKNGRVIKKLPAKEGVEGILTLLHTTSGVDFRLYKSPTIQRRIQRRMSLRKIKKFERYLDYLKKNPAEAQELYQDLLIRVTSFLRDPVNQELKSANKELSARNAELKSSFEQLAESRNALDEAQSVARVGSWSWDVKTSKVAWSAELYRIYGLKPGDRPLTFDSFLERLPADDASAVRERVQQAVKDGKPFQLEHRILRPDGTFRILEARGRVVKDTGGKVCRLIGTGQDITEKRQSEEALRQSEERFRLLVETVQDYAIFLLDPDGNVATWNAGAERLKGYAPEEIIGRHFSVFYLPEDKGRTEEGLRVAVRKGVYCEEGWRLRKDGSRFWTHATLTVLRAADKKLLGFAMILRDMTERKRIEDALEASNRELESHVRERTAELEQAYRALNDFFENATVGLHWVGPDGTILRANRTELEMLGYEPHEYVGRHIAEFHADSDVIEDILKRLTSGEKLHSREARLKCRDGSIRHVLISSDVYWEDGKFVHTRCFTRDVTEKRLAEIAIAESEERFRTMADSAPVMIWTSRADGRRDYFNKPWLNFTGASLEKNAGEGWLQFVHSDDAELLVSVYGAAIRERGKFRYEYRLRRYDGQYRWVLAHGEPRFRDGEFAGMIGSVIDITARKREEENLRLLAEANEILSRTLNAQKMAGHLTRVIVPHFADWCAVYLTKEDGSIEHAVIAHGDSAKVEIARDLVRRYPPSPGDPHGAGHVIRTGQAEFIQEIQSEFLEAVAKDAHHLSVLKSLGLVSGMTVPLVARDRAYGAITFVTSESGRRYDATDLSVAREIARRTALALDNARLYEVSRENEGSLRTLSEAIPQIVWTTRPDGNVDYFNARWYEYTGLSPDASLGQGWLVVLHPDDKAKTIQSWLAAVHGEGAYDVEYRLRRSDGTYRWHLGRGFSQQDEHGCVVKWFGTCTEIHGQKLAEESLREKTLQLVESNKELEQFAYVASHDLQEPLRKIIAFSDRLKAREIPGMGATEKDYFDRMQGAALRMKTLIEDLLNFSRVTSKEALVSEVDLEQTLRETIQDLEARITQTGAIIETHALPVVLANPLYMKQLFQNLVGNSLKFSKKDVTPLIRVEGRADGDFHEITVTDNGIGFDEKYLDRIFKPFQRLHGREEYPGTGIGLAICQKIIQRQGGSLVARSRPGEGSVFTVRFPVKPPENP